jgi:hypothetical protein
MPQFMLKKKASTKKPKTKPQEIKKEEKDNDLGVETFSNGGLIFSTEISNIDLNLVSKDDLIQPLTHELDKIMPDVGSTYYHSAG